MGSRRRGTPAETGGGAVSCQVTRWLCELLERSGRPPERWVRDLPVRLETLRDPAQRVDWDLFCTLCERLQTTVGGPEALAALADRVAAETLAQSSAGAIQRWATQ